MRRLIIFAAAIVAALIPIASAMPAQAALGTNPPPGSGCSGPSCSVGLEAWISYKGNAYTPGNTGHAAVEETQPPCLWEPKGDQIAGSQYVINWLGTKPAATDPFEVLKSWNTAKQLLKNGGNPAGEWYFLPSNPNDTPQQIAECAAEPLFWFAPTGTTPPLPPIPPRILAEYAYNHMQLANPGITTSPVGKGFVNLATFVWWRLPKTQFVTASLPGGQAATVVARPVKESISVSPAGSGTPFVASCNPATGSAFPKGNAPATGAGQAPDCGVLWTQSATGATITVTVTWQVVFHQGAGRAFVGNPVPGNPNPTTASTSAPIRVTEIQSINGA